jgi:hypothetical protein
VAQSSRLPVWKNQDDYCRDNPKMPTCIKTGPIDLSTINPVYKPSTGPSRPVGGTRRTTPSSSMPDMAPAPPVALEGWRFSHSAPALLISVNIASLLKSPVWNPILPAAARSALSEIGQLLISVDANGAANPSVLMLAKGNIDGALGAWLRSSAGMDARRLDAITLLIGDAHSLQFADLRLRGPVARQTSNLLQQTATREALKYDLWIGIDPRRLVSMAAAFGARPNPAMNGLANLRGISLGIYLRDEIRVEALMDAPSPEIADRMLAAYQEQQQQGKAGRVWTTVEGARLRYVEIAQLSQLTESPLFDPDTARIIQPHIDRLIQSLSSLAQPPAPAPKPASTGPIVIQGLGAPK